MNTTEWEDAMRPGDVLFERFRIGAGLKTGGMARVWLAEDLHSGETVAVKALGRDYWPSLYDVDERSVRSEALKRFERERDLLDKFAGPGIPRLLGYGFFRGDPCLVMELISGKNLRDFLSLHQPPPMIAAAAIGVQILEILDRIHKGGVVHRDLKPQNVVLANSGTVHIIDFGIALPTDPQATRYTRHGHTPGSTGYMAPEIIRGVKNPTPAADLYGFGCMLYEFVTAKQVFSELPDRSIEDQHRNDLAPRLDPARHPVGADLAELTGGLLQKEAADRPSLADGLEVLRRYLPRLGDPAPSPRLHPDPTLPFREGRESPPVPVPPAPVQRQRPSVKRRLMPSRREFGDLLEAAEREVMAQQPGTQTERVAAQAREVEAAWGPRERLVVRAQLVRADRARLEGDWPGAGRLYRTVERTPLDAKDVDLLLEARVGVAECLVPEKDDTEAAFTLWKAVVVDLRGLSRSSLKVHWRCREFAAELAEWGHRDEVETMLGSISAVRRPEVP
ncbi:serine/threonine protein kinase [Spongiactinospora rosea]|uniref:serine/threonine protein kinase n=1 Tax=Spongiactinospora rosea TaxID=2248750 RepID=UPI0013146875|nr:serine/threonine-protein kinase [Spongiactinospora rosea]